MSAQLKELSVSDGTLTPEFSPSNRFYAVTIPYEVQEISVTAGPKAMGAEIVQLPENPIALDVGDTEVSIAVTPPDDSSTLVYSIAVTRLSQETWVGLADPAWFGAFAIDPVDPLRIYAAYDDGVYKTIDGGDNWTEIPLFVFDDADAIVIDPMNTDTLYLGVSAVGTGGTGVYRSENRGNTWTQLIDTVSVSSLAIDPNNTSRLYAGTIGGTFAGDTVGVLVSDNSGDDWTPTNVGLANTEIIDVRVSPDDTQVVFAATEGGLYKSDDAGETWYLLDNGLPSGVVVLRLAIDPQFPETLYAATLGDGIYRSDDRGSEWSASNSGISALTTNDILIHPLNSNLVYAATADGVFRSGNAGTNWSKLPDDGVFWTGDVGTLAISPAQPSQLYALFSSTSTGARIYRRTEAYE